MKKLINFQFLILPAFKFSCNDCSDKYFDGKKKRREKWWAKKEMCAPLLWLRHWDSSRTQR
jgi:hypothetical protein